MLQEMVVRQRDELIYRARRQLRVRDLIIAAQQELLEAHGLSVGPHIESLFARLEPTDEICDESWYAARNPMMVAAASVSDSNGHEEAIGASKSTKADSALATWAIKKAVYPVSKIDDIVTVDLAQSLQVSRSKDKKDSTTTAAMIANNKKQKGGLANRQKSNVAMTTATESKSKDKRRPHQHVVAPVPIDAPAPGRHRRRSGGGAQRRRHRSRSRDRPKVNRSRSQMQMHRDNARPAPGAPYRQVAPSARELERAKRRGDRVGAAGAAGRQQRERMVVWEEGKSAVVKDCLDDVRAMIGANARGVGTSSSSSHLNDRENRDNWDIDIHKKRGVASDGRHKRRAGRPRRLDSHGSMDDHEVGLNTGWAERLKMYLKTPRSRFSRNKPGRSRSKSPSKRVISGGSASGEADAAGSKDAGKQLNPSSDTNVKSSQLSHRHQPSAPKSSSSSSRLSTSVSTASPHTPEGKCAPRAPGSSTTERDTAEGKTFSVSPASAPTATMSALRTTFSPTTMKAESISMTVKDADDVLSRPKGSGGVMCPTPPSPVFRNDENAHNSSIGSSLGRKMTPLPMIEKKDQRRFSSSPVPSSTKGSSSGGGLFASSGTGPKGTGGGGGGGGADEGGSSRRALSIINRGKKKNRRGGPVTSRPFWGKPRPAIPGASQ
jgi:hypothetical protein